MNARAMVMFVSAATGSMVSVQAAEGQAVKWSANGHWYQVLPMAGQTSHAAAVTVAASRGGVLVSMGSAAENAFVTGLSSGLNASDRVWMGLSKDPQASNAADGWYWDDGTPFSYTNWFTGQPDNAATERNAHT